MSGVRLGTSSSSPWSFMMGSMARGTKCFRAPLIEFGVRPLAWRSAACGRRRGMAASHMGAMQSSVEGETSFGGGDLIYNGFLRGCRGRT
jgi:hypothetical protein